MNYNRLRITEKIVLSKEAITIALNDVAITEALSKFGFSQDRLSGGLSIQEVVQTLENKRQEEYSRRLAATADADALYADVLAAFQTDRRIVLAVARNKPGFAERLRIANPVERRRDAFLFQVQAFYGEMLEDAQLRADLEPYNFTEVYLGERMVLVNAFADALHEQQRLSGVSLVATKEREQALASLDNYMAEFIGAARLAFRQDKEQLQKLGIRVR